MVDKKPLLRKFDYSAKTGKPYDHKSHQEKIREHRQEVIATLQALKEENVGKDITIFEVRPVPDILMVDWEQKKIIATEVSKFSQHSEKTRKYEGTEWPRILLIKAEKGKGRVYAYLRYRRISRTS